MSKPPIRILLVEDNPADARLLQLLLAEKVSFPSAWTHVQRLSQAIDHLAADQPDVVLLDLSLPDGQGTDTLTALQSHASHIPIVVITGTDDETIALNSMQAGAQDYLVKGQIDSELLSRTLRYSIERKLAEEALGHSEKRFRALIENAPDGIALLGMDGKLQQVTPTVEQMLGYTLAESLGQDPAQLTHPDDLPELLALLGDLIEHPGKMGRTVYRFRHKDGSWRWLESTITNLIQEPSVQAILFNYRDITQGRLAEQRLREREAEFRSLFEDSPISLWVEDFSEVKAYLEQLKNEGPENISASLQHPEVVRECARRVQILEVNSAAIKLYHAREKSRLLGNLLDVFPNLSLDQFKKELALLLDGQLNFEWEGEDETLTGEQIYISLRWTVAPGYENSLGRLIVSTIDVTERRRAEEYIRYQSDLLQNVSDAIIGSDLAFQITSWNPAAESIYGWRAEEVIGRPVNEILQTEYESADPGEVLRKFMAQGFWRGEAIQRRRDGTKITLLSSVSQVRDGSGKHIGTVAINRDITDRKRAEARIQHQLQRLSSLHSIDVAISSTFDMNISLSVLLGETLRQLSVDAADVLLFDPVTLTLAYAAGKGFASPAIQNTRLRVGEGMAGSAALDRRRVHIPDLDQVGSAFLRRDMLREDRFRSYIATPLVAKGEIKGVLEIFHRSALEPDRDWLSFLDTLAGQAAIAIDNAQLFRSLQDSNATLERRVAERTAELNQTNTELERANRIKDEFLANMSHELRTPLTSILGLSESLLEQRTGTLTGQQQRSLEIIASSGSHLLELINDILDLSKIEAGKFDYYPQIISVDEICRSCLAFVRAQAAKKSIHVAYQNEAAAPRIYADPRRLKQILVNLLSNAVKFTLEHGRVTLQVHTVPERDVIRFSVIDTGIGIAPEDLQRLFQPFVQVDSRLNRQHEGTGLGLALVQRLTDLHGGSVTVESEAGKGSCFTVSLPSQVEAITQQELPRAQAAGPDREQGSQARAPSQTASRQGLVLLADDSPSNILTIGEYLKNHGYEVVVAQDGLEAIEKAAQMLPDIILMDIQMPVIDGLEAMARLRRDDRFTATPIIALTALAMPGDRERCLQAGADEYMSKPVSLKALRETIETLLHGGAARPSRQ